MRCSGTAPRLATLALLLGGAALADEGDRPDPTVVRSATDEGGPSADPCDDVPQCRLDRFRHALARQRRREYLRRLSLAARRMDERLAQSLPARIRYPFEVDAHFTSNLAYGINLSYAPKWWLRVEGFFGAYPSHSSSYTDPMSMTSTETRLDGLAFGTGARVMPIKWYVSPYAAVGWAMMSGNVSAYGNVFNGGNSTYDSAVGHLVDVGFGAELVLPYFHMSIGYQLAYAFYAQASNSGMHDDQMRPALKKNFDDNMHGVAFQIGVVF
jgi:hypothetical protein